jgi:protein TonB
VLIVATAIVAGLTWGIARQRTSQIDPRQVITVNLAAARLAIEDQRLVEPPEHSAAYYYRLVLTIDPTNEAARVGLDSLSEQLLEIAKNAILEQRFSNAVEALDDVRRIAPSHRRIPFIEAELRKALNAYAASMRAPVETNQPAERVATAGLPKPTRSADGPPERNSTSPAKEAPPAKTERVDRVPSAPSAPGTATLASVAKVREHESSSALAAIPIPSQSPSELETSTRQLSPQVDAPLSGQAHEAQGPMQRIEPAIVAPQSAAGGVAEPEPVSVTAARIEPKIVRMVPPEYPNSARDRGIEGWVDLTLIVAPSGEVVDARVDAREGAKSFERAALAAVRKWKYEIEGASGSSTPLDVPVRVAFRLEE